MENKIESLNSSSRYSIFVMSDPQAWRLALADNDPNNDSNRWHDKLSLVRLSITMLNIDLLVPFGIINGDLTEYGRRSQRESYRTFFSPQALTFNVYVGLGNHDYQNNVGDCTEPDNADFSYNACARGMVFDMHSRIEEYRDYPSSINFSYDSDIYWGSKAYSWDYGDIHYVQLQNYPTYHVELDHCIEKTISVTSSMDWLESDLKSAKQRGKSIVINLHDGTEHFIHNSTTEEKNRFRRFMSDYDVRAVFIGHTHQVAQENPYGGHEFFGNVKVYNSGALFKGDFLVVDVNGRDLKVHVYNGSSGKANYIKTF